MIDSRNVPYYLDISLTLKMPRKEGLLVIQNVNTHPVVIKDFDLKISALHAHISAAFSRWDAGQPAYIRIDLESVIHCCDKLMFWQPVGFSLADDELEGLTFPRCINFMHMLVGEVFANYPVSDKEYIDRKLALVKQLCNYAKNRLDVLG